MLVIVRITATWLGRKWGPESGHLRWACMVGRSEWGCQVHGDVLKHTGPSLRSELSEGDKSTCQCAAAGSIGDLSGGAERVEYGKATTIELHSIHLIHIAAPTRFAAAVRPCRCSAAAALEALAGYCSVWHRRRTGCPLLHLGRPTTQRFMAVQKCMQKLAQAAPLSFHIRLGPGSGKCVMSLIGLHSIDACHVL